MTYEVGDQVQLAPDVTTLNYSEAGGWGYVTITNTEVLTIRRVTANKALVRNEDDTASFWIEKSSIQPADPNAPKPRKLGDVPEGMLSPDDPRLTWLWEDAATLADKLGHCSTYDSMADKLGIPGRERNFKVTRKINGFEVSRSYKARSKKLAEALFDEELKGTAFA